MEKNNLELWNKVEVTDPNYTKKANVKGNNITSIAPQFQLKNATEQFGVYGVTWGFRNMNIDYTLSNIGMVSFKATFFFPKGEFEIINSAGLYRDNAMTKIDDNFAKKLETDTITKALSKLGFNADIFLGKFDDARYLEDVTKQFETPEQKKEKEDRKPAFKEGGYEYLISDKATKEHIKTALDVNRMTPTQREILEKKFNNGSD